MNKKIIFFFGIIFISIGFISAASLRVNDPTTCPSSNDALFPGVSCAPEDICGDISGTPFCLNTAGISVPSPTTTTSNLGLPLPGFGVDCYNVGSSCANNILCQRDSACYNVNRLTQCTDWGVAQCDVCISGYTFCDGSYTDGNGCEINIGTTAYPGESNAVYNSGCGPQCSSGYLDCDIDLGSSGTGCEIQTGVTPFGTANAVYFTCTTASCSSGWMACGGETATGDGCNYQIGGSCTTGEGKPGTWSSGCICTELAQEHFITNTLARGWGNYLLSGEQWNPSGWLMNLTHINGGSIGIDNESCIVFSDGSKQCNGSYVAGGGVNLSDYMLKTGDNATGRYTFGGDWLSGGVTIDSGDIFAQRLYVFNITSLAITHLNVNGSLIPNEFDNTFDIGSATNSWRRGYFGDDIFIDGESINDKLNVGWTLSGDTMMSNGYNVSNENNGGNIFWVGSSNVWFGQQPYFLSSFDVAANSISIMNGYKGASLTDKGLWQYDSDYTSDMTNDRVIVDRGYVESGLNNIFSNNIDLGDGLRYVANIHTLAVDIDSLFNRPIGPVHLDYTGINNDFKKFDAGYGYIYLGPSDAGGSGENPDSESGIIFNSSYGIHAGPSPINYLGNYSSIFTDRSLVDKEYVDNAIGSGGLYDFTNGLIESGGNVSLGGGISENINIDISNGAYFQMSGLLPNYGEVNFGTPYSLNAFRVFGNYIGVISANQVDLGVDDGVGGGLIRFTTTANTFFDYKATSTGLMYAADYSGGFVNRSLVDKEYVDNVIDGGGSYGFINGLNESGGNVSLGGVLTKNTFIQTTPNYEYTIRTNDDYSQFLQFKKDIFDVYLEDRNSNYVEVFAEPNSYWTDVYQDSTGYESYFEMSPNQIYLNVESDLSVEATLIGGQGFVYGNDYSGGFVNRSLVDKEYVDTLVAEIGGVNTSSFVPYLGATRNLDLGIYKIFSNNFYTNDTTLSTYVGEGISPSNNLDGIVAVGYFSANNNDAASVTSIGALSGLNNKGIGLTAVGSNAGVNNFGGNVVSIGKEAGVGNFGNDSIFIGAEAGYNNSQNSVLTIGHQAGYGNKGFGVTALGYQSANLNENNFLTAVGSQAGVENSGERVEAFGVFAAGANIGNYVVAMGASSGTWNEGNDSVFVGSFTGQSNKGNSNTFIGAYSGSASEGNQNIGLGTFSANAVTGNFDIGIGYSALLYNSGNNSIGIGTDTLKSNAGNNVIAIGSGAGFENIGNNNIFIGAGVGLSNLVDNRLMIDIQNTTTPLIDGDFSANNLTINGNLIVTQNMDVSGCIRYNGGILGVCI